MIKYLLTLTSITFVLATFSQGVSINSTGNAASSDAMLDINSTASGLLIPRMTQAQRNAITTPSTSLLLYQTDADSGFYFYDGTNWTPFLIGGNAANSGWATKGNNGTVAGTNFIGTTDAVDWVIKTNNGERARVDQNGNVGIGTTTPNDDLVVGTDLGVSTSGTGIAIGETAGTYAGLNMGEDANNRMWMVWDVANDYTFFGNRVSGTTYQYNLSLNTGNVGVGIANPKSALHVTDLPASMGSFPLDTSDAIVRIEESASTLYMDGNAITTNVSNGLFLGNVANGPIVMGTNNTARMWIKGDGNIGIGTSVPQHNLQILDDDAESVLTVGEHNGSTKDSSGFSIAPWSDGSIYIDTKIGTGGKLRFRYGEGAVSGTGNSWFTMDGGNVGFNTSAPRGRFDVDGTGNIYLVDDLNDGGTQAVYLPGTITFAPWNGGDVSYLNAYRNGLSGSTKFRFRVTNSGVNVNAMEIASNGYVGIGTTGPSHLLHVTGIARSTQSTWATTSDKRVKTKIENLDDGLNTILKIRPVEFEYSKKYQKYNKGYEGKKRGFIAQEVKEVLPDMVNIIEETVGKEIIKDFHLLSNSDFTPILVKAIQEQQQIIENQKAAISLLQAEMQEVKNILNQTGKK